MGEDNRDTRGSEHSMPLSFQSGVVTLQCSGGSLPSQGTCRERVVLCMLMFTKKPELWLSQPSWLGIVSIPEVSRVSRSRDSPNRGPSGFLCQA